MKKDKMENEKIINFKGKGIRRIFYRGEWYFSVGDVVGALVDSKDLKQYIKKMRKRDTFLDRNWGTICTPLKILARDGKQRVNCANKKGIFRIIQSIPSKRAEPFKLWLAKVGSDRIDEIENPELIQERMKDIYEKKGYSKTWVDKRLRGVAVRQDLTNEWIRTGVDKEEDFAILTNDLTKAWSGRTIKQYKKLKKLRSENLREFRHGNSYWIMKEVRLI